MTMLRPSWLGNVLCELLQQADTELRALLFTATELDHGLDLVTLREELQCVLLLGLVVMGVDLQTEADLLEDRVGLVLAGFASLDRRLVLVLAEIHQLAHGGLGVRGHLDQIEVGFLGQAQGILNTDDPDLFTVGTDHPHLWDADTIVDTWVADVELLVC
jgi:hypothetical protein